MMEKMISAARPLTVDRSFNTRDLGGYPAAGGKKTAFKVFLRSDGLQALSKEGRRQLLDYGVGCVIDLRTEEERRQSPNQITKQDGVACFTVSLADGVASNGFEALPDRMGKMYVGLLSQSGEKLAEIFHIFASHLDRTILFHCSAGKDRTGVTAMLLLLLAGAPQEVIVTDYAASYENLKPLFEGQKAKMRELGVEIPEHVLRSDPEEIEMALDWLKHHDGTAERYLLERGVTQEELDSILRKFVR